MKFNKTVVSILALVLVFALALSACGSAPADKTVKSGTSAESSQKQAKPEKPKSTPDADGNVIRVSTVQELLCALTPGEKTVRLAAGVYDISDPGALPEGTNGYVRWEEVYDGYELILDGLDGVTLQGEGEVIISAIPRYANVITLENTAGFTMTDITLGHTVEPGQCAGGVVRLSGCRDILIDDCDLYGCGTTGVDADNCTAVTVNDSDIYDCSWNAATVCSCDDFRIIDCDIHDCGEGGGSLFYVSSTRGFALVNCDIENNSQEYFLNSDFCRAASILGCELEDNNFRCAVFMIQGSSPVVDGCGFSKNVFSAWYDSMNSSTPGVWAVSPNGDTLGKNELESMKQRDCSYDGYTDILPQVELSTTVNAEGLTEAHVKTVDELLAAIGDNTVIYLDSPLYDLSSASDYGWASKDSYSWRNSYDGNELNICKVYNLSIVGDGAVISTVPRCANVLVFDSCKDITLKGVTVGHTELPGVCSGGVVYLSGCTDITVDSCRLYGCGTVGIAADNTDGIQVVDTEIFDCSYNAASIVSSEDISFSRCSIHDCGLPELYIESFFSFDGKDYEPGSYHMENGVPSGRIRLCLSVGDKLFKMGDDGKVPVIELSANTSPVTVTVKKDTGDSLDPSVGWWYVDSGDMYYEVNGDGTVTIYPKNSTPGISGNVYFSSELGDASLTVRIN